MAGCPASPLMSSSEPPVAIDDVAIVDALPAAVVVIDDHGTIIRANPRA